MMEHNAPKFAPEDSDIFSSLPDSIVTNILDRLPIQDAVRTSILSRNWRFKWTMLSQLVFDRNFFEYLLETQRASKFGRIVSRVLLHLKGDITKFVIYVEGRDYPVIDDEDVNYWILFLSKKRVKDLTLDKEYVYPLLILSAHLFSCLELTHLKLVSCRLDLPASFHGFPNLLSLELCDVQFGNGNFEEFFTRFPLLEILIWGSFASPSGKVKVDEIAKLVNLKVLSLSLCNLDYMVTKTVIIELVSFLPKLEELDLKFDKCEFKGDGAKRSLSTKLPRLKTLKLSSIDLENHVMFSFAFEMIRTFPNLQTFEISKSYFSARLVGSSEADYTRIFPLQLRSVVFTYCRASNNDLCLIAYLLAYSPFLKRMVIRLCTSLKYKDKFMFAKKLMKLRRASLVVDIDID